MVMVLLKKCNTHSNCAPGIAENMLRAYKTFLAFGFIRSLEDLYTRLTMTPDDRK